MNDFTPERNRPKKATMDFLRAFARNYHPLKGEDDKESEAEPPTIGLRAYC